MRKRFVTDPENQLWDNTHKNKRYSNRVFSLLDSDRGLEKVKMSLRNSLNCNSAVRALIPGCGSNPNLQVCCREVLGNLVTIDALDWRQEAIDISKAQTERLGIDVTYFRQSY